MKERIELAVCGVIAAGLLGSLLWTDAPGSLVWAFAVLTGGLGFSWAHSVGQIEVYRKVLADMRQDAERASEP